MVKIEVLLIDKWTYSKINSSWYIPSFNNKLALSLQDNKTFVIPGTFRTLAWGHKSISVIQSLQSGDDEEVNELRKMLWEETHTHNIPDELLNEHIKNC